LLGADEYWLRLRLSLFAARPIFADCRLGHLFHFEYFLLTLHTTVLYFIHRRPLMGLAVALKGWMPGYHVGFIAI
jgi:hypothetical protein